MNIFIFRPRLICNPNVLSSEGRSKACFDYAELRKTTNVVEQFLILGSPDPVCIISFKWITTIYFKRITNPYKQQAGIRRSPSTAIVKQILRQAQDDKMIAKKSSKNNSEIITKKFKTASKSD